jgi:hypothetical protein
MNRRVLAWILIGLGLLLGAVSVVSTVLEAAGLVGEDSLGVRGVVDAVVLAVPAIAFFAVGALLALRRVDHPVGWLCLSIGLLWFVVSAGERVSHWPNARPVFEAHPWLELLGGLWVPALGLMATHLPLRLPDGRLLSPRWRWFSRFCTFAIVIAAVVIVIDDDSPYSAPGLVKIIGPMIFLLPLCFLGGVGCVIARYRSSSGIERLQLRVIAFAGLVFLGSYAVGLFANTVYDEGTWPTILASSLVLVAYASIPAAIGTAVLRYRLYDVDTVINRTLVYTALTATLAAAYVGGVLLLQFALRPLTDRSDLAVAGSTLAVAALFRPVRSRIQGSVDRRFYRSRYDAARTLDAFGARLREQLDLEALSSDLRLVVRDTVHPTQVSLWLRP